MKPARMLGAREKAACGELCHLGDLAVSEVPMTNEN
jgi:hypothetical protein